MQNSVNWLKIRDDFERSGKSVRLLAKEYGISDTAIHKRQKADGWQRLRAINETRQFQPVVTPRPVEISTRPRIEDLADKGQELAARMLDELDAITTREGELVEMIGQAAGGDDDAQKRDAMMRAVSLPSRTRTLKDLTGAIKTLGEFAVPNGKKAAARAAALAPSHDGIGALIDRLHATGRAN
jgi:hypothetical protein